MIERNRISAAVVFTLTAALAGGLIAVSHELSRERIAANQRDRVLASLSDVLGATRFDNGADVSAVTANAIVERSDDVPTAVFRAARDGASVATVYAVTAPSGYNGPIQLLVGVASDGTVTGVRVIAHRETPGLGDPIERGKSSWIETFTGKRLGDPPLAAWRLSKDGGTFDGLTGATVTPRAIVDAVKATLVFDRSGAAVDARPSRERADDDG